MLADENSVLPTTPASVSRMLYICEAFRLNAHMFQASCEVYEEVKVRISTFHLYN